MTGAMTTLLLLAATAPPQAADESGTLQMILLALVGMLVVFLALSLIGGIMKLLGRYLSQDVDEAAAEEAAAPATATAGVPTGIEPRTLAVLTAAACAAAGRPVRVRRVTFINENTVSGWKEAGRQAVQSSHNLGRSL